MKTLNSIRPIIKELEKIYDTLAKHYNIKAKRPIITIQTQGRRNTTLGWYWKNKWKRGKERISEINICAESLNKNPIETLIHEMVHYYNALNNISDCNSQQYHNKYFKQRAENYGLNVKKDGRHGWSNTSISDTLQKVIDKIKINKQVFLLCRKLNIITKSHTKMLKYSCGCTIVRCATILNAQCKKCNNEFKEE